MAFNTRNTHIHRQSRGATRGGYRVQPYENDYRQRRSQKLSGADESYHTDSREYSGSYSSRRGQPFIQRPEKAYGVYRNPYLSTQTVQSRPPTLLERLSAKPILTEEDTESDIASSRESSPAPSTQLSRTLGTIDINVEVVPVLSREVENIKSTMMYASTMTLEQESHPDVEEGEIVDIPGFSMIAAIKERELPQQLYLYTAMGALLSDWDDLLNDFESEYSRPLPSYAWE